VHRSGSSQLKKNFDQSEQLRANQPKGALTYAQNEIIGVPFHHLLKDMYYGEYYGEKQIAEAVKMTKRAASAEPRCAFEHPRKETE